MNLKVSVLGTSAGSPTADRAHTSIVITYKGDVLLFDCGENTQVRLMQSNLRFMKINHIFITHFHGDHFFGLPGLLFSFSLNDRIKPLKIYGPQGIKTIEKAFSLLGIGDLSFKVEYIEIGHGSRIDLGDYYIEAAEVCHSIKTLAYAFVEKDIRKISDEKCKKIGLYRHPLLSKLQKGIPVLFNGKKINPEDVTARIIKGRKIVFSGDTRPSENLIQLTQGADVLIHEATYSEDSHDNAVKNHHSTAREAAMIASRAGVRHLLLTHFSKRYKDTSPLIEEAKDVFPNVTAASDLFTMEIPFSG